MKRDDGLLDTDEVELKRRVAVLVNEFLEKRVRIGLEKRLHEIRLFFDDISGG